MRHALCNYTYGDSELQKGTLITIRHQLQTFFGFIPTPNLCDISMNMPKDIPAKEWAMLDAELLAFVDTKLAMGL